MANQGFVPKATICCALDAGMLVNQHDHTGWPAKPALDQQRLTSTSMEFELVCAGLFSRDVTGFLNYKLIKELKLQAMHANATEHWTDTID